MNSATYLPFETAFIENPDTNLEVFELIVNCYFILDVVVNFISAYETKDKNVEYRFSHIACNYMASWFVLDVVSCIPFQMIQESTSESLEEKDSGVRLLLRML